MKTSLPLWYAHLGCSLLRKYFEISRKLNNSNLLTLRLCHIMAELAKSWNASHICQSRCQYLPCCWYGWVGPYPTLLLLTENLSFSLLCSFQVLTNGSHSNGDQWMGTPSLMSYPSCDWWPTFIEESQSRVWGALTGIMYMSFVVFDALASWSGLEHESAT